MPSTKEWEARVTPPAENELQAMLGHPPGWILRSGIIIIALVVGATLLLSWIIRYPDEIAATVVVQQPQPLHELRPLITGRIDTLLYPEHAPVEPGSRLAFLESAAEWRHVDSLWQCLRAFEQRGEGALEWPSGLQLGNLQAFYANFLQAWEDWRFFNQRSIFDDRQKSLQEEIATLSELRNVQLEQRRLFLDEKAMMEVGFQRIQFLYQDSIASAVDLEGQRIQLLKYEQQLKGLEINFLQNEGRIQQLKVQLAENEDRYRQELNARRLAYVQAKRQLLGALEEWENQYVLTSPVEGQLEYLSSIHTHSSVQAGELLGKVVPDGQPGRAIVHLQMSANGIGKVTVGSPVKISLDAYPDAEFGQVAAKVSEISNSPLRTENGEWRYELKAYLPATVRTNYGKYIELTPAMPGRAMVITKDSRILERLLQKFTGLIRN